MEPKVWKLIGVFALTAMAAQTAEATSLRCKGQLVTVGMTALELRLRCGEPDQKEVRPVLQATGTEVIQTAPNPRQPGVQQGTINRQINYTREQVETWMYAAKDGSLARLVTIRKGTIEAIRTTGQLAAPKDPGCVRGLVKPGTPITLVRQSCGVPDDVARWETQQEAAVSGIVLQQLVVHERWVYALGEQRLSRIVEFENGKLVRIRTGRRLPKVPVR